MRRIELLQPKKDLERSKRMTEGTNKPEIIAAKKITRKAPNVEILSHMGSTTLGKRDEEK